MAGRGMSRSTMAMLAGGAVMGFFLGRLAGPQKSDLGGASDRWVVPSERPCARPSPAAPSSCPAAVQGGECPVCPSRDPLPPAESPSASPLPSRQAAPPAQPPAQPPATQGGGGERSLAPTTSVAYLRGLDLHMRGVCVTANMPYSVMGMSRESCGDEAFRQELMNATKNRVRTCKHEPKFARAVCKGYGLFCGAADDPLGGETADFNKLVYVERAALAPVEFWDYNYGHIVTDGAMAVAAVRARETGAFARAPQGAGAEAAAADGTSVFLWRARAKEFTGDQLGTLWKQFMLPNGLRYLPVSDQVTCFGTVTILAQPLNMLSWQRLAAAPFLRMAEAWSAYARLVQFPSDHADRDAFYTDAYADTAAAAIDARGADPGMGGLQRSALLRRVRSLRKAVADRAPTELRTGPSCAAGSAAGRRKPRVLAIKRTGKRKVTNMDALLSWFRDRGYDAAVWAPEGKSAQEQAQEVQGADVFVSNHGQGQAWGMFMREDAVMLTLCSDNQLHLGSCTYYPVATRNGGHSPRRIVTVVSKDAHFFGGGRKTDEYMRQQVQNHGGKDASDWHYKNTHWDDIDVNLEAFGQTWAARLGGSTGDAGEFWEWWCRFDDVIQAANDADGEALPSQEGDAFLSTRLPRLGDGISLV